MTHKWKYGDSWEHYPIQRGEIWIEETTHSKLMVWDIFEGFPAIMKDVDMIYIDPPWNPGNLNCFYTKAGYQETNKNYKGFLDVLFTHINAISPKVCYLEIGKQNISEIDTRMQNEFPIVETWNITYYRKHPAYLVRGSQIGRSKRSFNGEDDMYTPYLAIEAEKEVCHIIGDLCCGRGLIPLSAFRLGKSFRGTELNPRRLAVAIEKISKKGGKFNHENTK